MDALKNACLKQSYISFTNLTPGEYIVRRFTLVEGKFDRKRVRIDLDTWYMYLPERFASKLDGKAIADLNTKPRIMIYAGKDANNRNRLMLDFHDVAYFTDELQNIGN